MRPSIACLCLVLVALSGTAGAQTAAPAKPTTPISSASGRFQLLAQPEGQIFMIDSATGRVLRDTRVTPTDQQVKTYINRLITVEERQRAQPYTESERTARDAALRAEHADAISSLANPCLGVSTCLVELDRVKLTSTGEFASEIVKPPSETR